MSPAVESLKSLVSFIFNNQFQFCYKAQNVQIMTEHKRKKKKVKLSFFNIINSRPG